jgi:hypothetical protein
MESMTIIELKKLAKERRIKQYYIMRRAQLIQILSLSELPKYLVLEKKTIIDLREEAKQKGMRGFWRMSRAEILELLYPDSPKSYENNSQAPKHDHPDSHDSKDVGVEVSEDPLENRS